MMAVVGIGNPFSEDDSLGLKIAEKLSKTLKCELRLLTSSAFDVLDAILEFEEVIIVDTFPGKGILRLEVESSDVNIKITHELDVLETLKIGKFVFEEFPKCKVILIGVDTAKKILKNPEILLKELRENEG